jgi:REP element-mobilizing transposase RayT
MAKTLGYMITWTTYGTWLQGDERGYVKKGLIRSGSKGLMQANRRLQLQDAVQLSKLEQQVVRKAIMKEAVSQGHHIYALSVQPTHVHVVIAYTPESISTTVAYYKKAGRLALKCKGYTGKLWTRGYDKRFCFDEESLKHRIEYVEGQNPA